MARLELQGGEPLRDPPWSFELGVVCGLALAAAGGVAIVVGTVGLALRIL